MILPPPPPAPRPPFALEALSRLPLAEAFYTAWAYLATDDTLDELFTQHRGRCYQDQLRFPELVAVLADASPVTTAAAAAPSPTPSGASSYPLRPAPSTASWPACPSPWPRPSSRR